MRFTSAILWCFRATLLWPLALAGCNPGEQALVSSGIGTDLYTNSLPDQTQQLEAYIGEICRQAGLAAVGPDCRIADSVTPEWMLFVQGGMNDIDRRCDAYLQWLDDRRRTSNALLHEIGDTQTGIEAGMAAAHVASLSLAVVTAAFGFARNTLTNLNSRLLFEVDRSTVQVVVLTRQKEFRKNLPDVIDNRPAAIYAVRSYLRICLPYTIETEINNTITLFARGGKGPIAGLVTPANIHAQMTSSRVAEHVIIDVTKPPPGPGPRPESAHGAANAAEGKILFVTARRIQSALCHDPNGDLGPLAPLSTTRQSINEYLRGRGKKAVSDKGLSDAQRNLLNEAADLGDCRSTGFKNAFEVGAFGAPKADSSGKVIDLQHLLQAVVDIDLSAENGQMGPQTRAAIETYRKNTGRLLNKSDEKDPINSQVDARLFRCIRDGDKDKCS